MSIEWFDSKRSVYELGIFDNGRAFGSHQVRRAHHQGAFEGQRFAGGGSLLPVTVAVMNDIVQPLPHLFEPRLILEALVHSQAVQPVLLDEILEMTY